MIFFKSGKCSTCVIIAIIYIHYCHCKHLFPKNHEKRSMNETHKEDEGQNQEHKSPQSSELDKNTVECPSQLNCEHGCLLNNGNSTCRCPAGFILEGDKCADIDECQPDNGPCQEVCTNMPGSFKCECPKGLRLHSDGKTCEDINECSLRDGRGPCQATCENTRGSYKCGCLNGEELDEDGHNCRHLNECQDESSGCSHGCVNNNGRVVCTCPAGMEPGFDGKTCKDINECDDPNIDEVCPDGCVNTIGSFFCEKKSNELPSKQELHADDYEDDYEDDDYEDDNYSDEDNDEDDDKDKEEQTNHNNEKTVGRGHKYLPPDENSKFDSGSSNESEVKVPTTTTEPAVNESYSNYSADVSNDKNHEAVEINPTVNESKLTSVVDSNLSSANNTTENPDKGSDKVHYDNNYEDEDDDDDDDDDDYDEYDEKSSTVEPPLNKTTIIYSNDHDYNRTLSHKKTGNEQENTLGQVPLSPHYTEDEYDDEDYDDEDYKEEDYREEDSDKPISINNTTQVSNKESYTTIVPSTSTDQFTESSIILTSSETSSKEIPFDGTSEGEIHIKFNTSSTDGGQNKQNGTEKSGLDSEKYDIDEDSYPSEVPPKNAGINEENGTLEEDYTENYPQVVSSNSDIKEISEAESKTDSHSPQESNSGENKETTEDESAEKELDEDDSTEDYEDEDYEEEDDKKSDGGSNEVYTDKDSSSCSEGYQPDQNDLCIDIDECQLKENSCSDGCQNTIGSYRCTCPVGFELSPTDPHTCQDINECLSHPCSHECFNMLGSYHCECPVGFFADGTKCQAVYCSHGFQTIDNVTRCSCPEGFVLGYDNITCEDIDECLNHNCSQLCHNSPGSYECRCNAGFRLTNGTTCIDIDECFEDHPCSDICENTPGSFQCKCGEGFHLDHNNKTCLDIDECSDKDINDCEQMCQNYPGGYDCFCHSGYKLSSDQVSCWDIDECIDNNANCSQICNNLDGSYGCACNVGFSLNHDNTTCAEINKCSIDNGGCSHYCEYIDDVVNCLCPERHELYNDTICIEKDLCLDGGCSHICSIVNHAVVCSCPHTHELINSTHCDRKNPCLVDNGGCSHFCNFQDEVFSCSCPDNYYLEGTICYRDDPCLKDNGGCSHQCLSDDEGKVTCLCPPGFRLENSQCVKLNSCLIENGGCSHICRDNDGTPICSCPDNFILIDDKKCHLLDPCETQNGGCSHTCTNVNGLAKCSCPDHFNLVEGTKCVEVNPCFINNGGCSHECILENGTLYCLCPNGYKLDGKKCIRENPCIIKNGGCSHVCETINGQVICRCPPNYELINKTCFKINPCLINNGGCSHVCINNKGSAKCSCPPGYKLKGTLCTEDQCSTNNGGCSHFCAMEDDKRRCSCPAGYVLRPNKRICKEINECKVNRGGCSHGCKNLPGTFKCTCPVGLVLDHTNRTCHRTKGFTAIATANCSIPEPPKDGIITCSDSDNKFGGIVPKGTRCMVWCNEGFKLIGNSIRTCQGSDHWGSSEPQCLPASCLKVSPINHGYLHPNNCNNRHVYAGVECSVHCKKGYRVRDGYDVLLCNQQLEWEPENSPDVIRDICIRDVAHQYIKCPGKGLDFVLPEGTKYMDVEIPRPETNVDWSRFVKSEPDWGIQLKGTLPAGKMEIKFFIVDTPSNTSLPSCTLTINVMDREDPRVYDCPLDMDYTLKAGDTSQLVYWPEPRFEDNVRIANVYKSREPGTSFGVGLHHISYIASDEAGNRAFCHFTIKIKDASGSNFIDETPQKYQAVLICPSGVQYMSQFPDNYDNQIAKEAGCYWKHVRLTKPIQPQAYQIPPHKVHDGSRLPPHLRTKHKYFDWYNKCC